ncbi:MAG: DUF3108 domain-containing protein [Bacteroidales bacterium]|nr:DUF3108 domain-containing protein [Bacteroidales bacterium]
MYRLLSLLIALMTVANIWAQCNLTNTAFKSGEVLSYSLHFNWKFVWVNVGTATMSISSSIYNGTPAYHAYLITRGSKTADKYFIMRDTLESYVDHQLNPLYYAKRALEGSSYRVDEAFYTYSGGKTSVKLHHINKHGQHSWATKSMSECIHDMLSMLLRARNFDASSYKKGQRLAFNMTDHTEVERRHIIYRGKEKFTIENTNNTYRCLVFDYVEQEGGKEKTIVTFYITDDANHIPVRLDMHLKFGSAKAYLKGMTGIRNKMTSRQ